MKSSKMIFTWMIVSGEISTESAEKTTDDLQIVLGKGGFHLKGITYTGFDPPDHLSNSDRKSVNVGGLKWFSKSGKISLNIDKLNFKRKIRGKKEPQNQNLMLDGFTRRDCAGRVGEVFDLIGRFVPLVVELKLDLHDLCIRKLDWDDRIPPDLISKWRTNFENISKMGELKFRRCIVPDDAVSLDIETLEMADSSSQMACSAIYARFKRKNGSYSCQLVFARSKIIPEGMSIPRAELLAATLNATTGHTVYLSLQNYVKTRMHFTDSQVALSWISNEQLRLKQWTRNRVIEINRLTDKNEWKYIESKNMMADFGTRRGAKLEDVLDESSWVCGFEWASLEKEKFPVKSFQDIKLD